MKNLTKSQSEIKAKLEHLYGFKLVTKALNKKCFLIELPESERFWHSRLVANIDLIVRQYGLGKVEPNGANYMAIRCQQYV